MRRRLRPITAAAVAIMLVASTLPASAHTRSRQPVVEIATGAVVGTSVAVRGAGAVTATLRTHGLEPGHAYTVWAVIFNDPAHCVDGCDGSDLANPEVGGVSVLATGGVARRDHRQFRLRLAGTDGLENPAGAEIHLVVRSHGPAIAGLIGEQISTLNGGCPPNTCANVLMAKHA